MNSNGYYFDISSQKVLGGGIYCSGTAAVRNCIIYGNRSEIDDEWSNCGSNVLSYSCTRPLVTGVGNMTNSPCFINSVGHNFHLASWSPCIDMGMNQEGAQGTLDFDGNPRVANRVVDMGAYEYSGDVTEHDYDGDTLSNADERMLYGSDPMSRDSDGDGMEDVYEVAAGTDPADDSSLLAVIDVLHKDLGIMVTWKTVFGKRYIIERCTDLASGVWTNAWDYSMYELDEFPEGSESFYDMTVPEGDTVYYRIRLEL